MSKEYTITDKGIFCNGVEVTSYEEMAKVVVLVANRCGELSQDPRDYFSRAYDRLDEAKWQLIKAT